MAPDTAPTPAAKSRIALARKTPGTGLLDCVGQPDMKGVPIQIGIHRNRGDSQLLAGPDDPDRDLATVGNQDFRQHSQAVCQA